MLKLYGYWRSTAAYRVRIALNHKGIEYGQESVHLVNNGGEQNHKDYKTINPQSLVPSLINVDGADKVTIAQSIAILEYLEERYPVASLLPTDIQGRAFVRQLCQVIACDVHPLNNLRVLKYLSNEFSIEDNAKTAWYHHWLELGFSAFDALLKNNIKSGPYCNGSELSMADACLIPQIYNANRFGFSMRNFPRLEGINNHCLELEAFQLAIPENQDDAG